MVNWQKVLTVLGKRLSDHLENNKIVKENLGFCESYIDSEMTNLYTEEMYIESIFTTSSLYETFEKDRIVITSYHAGNGNLISDIIPLERKTNYEPDLTLALTDHHRPSEYVKDVTKNTNKMRHILSHQ